MIVRQIARMLELCSTDQNVFPPTDLYNEGWMLRLLLDWHSRNPNAATPIPFPANSIWYSEALLPSAFLARYRGDELAESWTHADGVIGNFVIGAFFTSICTCTAVY